MTDFVAVPKLERSGGRIIASQVAAADPVVDDSLESGDFSYSENGFSWAGGYENPGGEGVFIADSDQGHPARTGRYSIEFRYIDNGTAEERFALGGNYPEIWVEYYFWIPSGWDDWDTSSSDNQKLFAVWGGPDYNVSGSAIAIPEWHMIEGQGVDANLTCYYGENGSTLATNAGNYSPWLREDGSGVCTHDAWTRQRIHLNVGTEGNSDGVYEVWTNGVKVLDRNDLHMYPDGGDHPYYSHGYIFGSLNADPNPETGMSCYVDDFKVYTSNPGWEN